MGGGRGDGVGAGWRRGGQSWGGGAHLLGREPARGVRDEDVRDEVLDAVRDARPVRGLEGVVRGLQAGAWGFSPPPIVDCQWLAGRTLMSAKSSCWSSFSEMKGG